MVELNCKEGLVRAFFSEAEWKWLSKQDAFSRTLSDPIEAGSKVNVVRLGVVLLAKATARAVTAPKR